MNRDLLRVFAAFLVTVLFVGAHPAFGATRNKKARFKVTLEGRQSTTWRALTRIISDYTQDQGMEGTELVDYVTTKPGLFEVKPFADDHFGRMAKQIEVSAAGANANDPIYSCTGNCPSPPDLSNISLECGPFSEQVLPVLMLTCGTFYIGGNTPLFSNMIGTLKSAIVGLGAPRPLSDVLVSLGLYDFPIGTMAPNCGPRYGPDIPGTSGILSDYRYPFVPPAFSDSSGCGDPSSGAVGKKLLNPKTKRYVKVVQAEHPFYKSEMSPVSGGYEINGLTQIRWKITLKRVK